MVSTFLARPADAPQGPVLGPILIHNTLFRDHLIYSLSLSYPLETAVLFTLPYVHSSFVSKNIWITLWRGALPHPTLPQGQPIRTPHAPSQSKWFRDGPGPNTSQ